MTTESPSRNAAPVALTPRIRDAGRAARFWIAIAAVAAFVVVLGVLLAGVGASTGRASLAPDDPAPGGARALAEVLEDHGVRVVRPHGFAAASAALHEGGATLLVVDPGGILSGDRLRGLRDAAAETVLVDPGFDALTALLPGVNAAGRPDLKAPEAGCALPAAVRAGRVTAGTSSFRVSDGIESCFADSDGRALLARDPSTATAALASGDIVSNERIVAHGNAALALGLLGEHPTLVWYVPTPADAAGGTPPSRADLTPGWVTPAVVVLIAAALAAALWRGRRLGPLVIEDLPVAVPARETMEGRARLYARSSARLRALDALRMGTVVRLASSLGLPRTASVLEVAGAAAARAGRHPDDVERVLLGAVPADDRELLALSAALEELEAAVRDAGSLSFSRAPERTEE